MNAYTMTPSSPIGLMFGAQRLITGIERESGGVRIYVDARRRRRYFVAPMPDGAADDLVRNWAAAYGHLVISEEQIPWLMEERDEGPDRLVTV